MEFREVVRRRRMTRRFTPTPVPVALVERLVHLARRAPSAGFSQGSEFLVLTEVSDRESYWRACTDSVEQPDRWLAGMMTAPVLIVCLSDPQRYLTRYAEPDKRRTREEPVGQRWPVPYWDVDTGMAALLLLLGAVDDDLGACFFGVPGSRHQAVRDTFGVPDDRRLVGVVALGYPDPAPQPVGSARRGRRPWGEVAHHGRFGVPFDAS